MKRNQNSYLFERTSRTNLIRYSELGLVLFAWFVLIGTPFLFRDPSENPLRKSLTTQLEILIPLFLVFLINRFILVPKILFKAKPVKYMIFTLGLIVLLAISSFVYDEKFKEISPTIAATPTELEQNQFGTPQTIDPLNTKPPSNARPPRPVPPFVNFVILSVLVVGFDTGIRAGLRWILAEDDKVRLEKENISTQLMMLRNQISPHFFMNTLNNIHALIDMNTEEAKESIIKLSKMMRYLLYETSIETTTLQKEVDFLESYINLMKLRFSEKVKIELNLPKKGSDIHIPPFLFIPFIENAFKHGISYKEESFVKIDMKLEHLRLTFTITNSVNKQNQEKELSGIGIENTRRRLDLLFNDTYQLDIFVERDVFIVHLSIPL